jgi:preprotein translocase subunit SecA
MLNRIVRIFGGDPNKREIDKLSGEVDAINALENEYEALSAETLRLKTDEFRRRVAQGEELDELLIEACAAVREASKRTIGLRHYDVQLIGGITLHQGKIAEMRTGEGKTLVATLPLYINALALNPTWVELAQQYWGNDPDQWMFKPLNGIPVSRGVHLITVNDYLARRDARWMAPIYQALGLSVGVLQMAARTENGKKAFLVDLERESPHEDQHQLVMVPRAEAYAADITYGTNSEFGFDYLRDNMTMRLDDRVQRGHYFAIVDEVDNVLIDEARTPLIISGPSHDDSDWYIRMAQVVRQLNPEDYEISERDRNVTLSEIGEAHVEELLNMALRDPDRPEDVTPEQARVLGYLEQALRAQFLQRKNKEYLVQGGKVVIIDEFTGRLMPGRRWSDGLHQAVEAKEGVRVQAENITYATITIQNYFRMYEKLAGMTGTALTEAEEFSKIYKLEVLPIPTNLEYMAQRPDERLIALEAKDEQGYKYTYYTRDDLPDQKALFWKRKDYPDVIYRTEEAKLRAIMQEILVSHVKGRPVLVGTTSVELSDRISNRLRAEPLRRLSQVMLLREAWFERHNQTEDGRAVEELAFMNQPLERLPINEMRKLARELDISMTPEDGENLLHLAGILGLGEEHSPRLRATLQAGIQHAVLNARKHTEESQIIAGAGAFGAATIATNMAGRGVDIKLGGELAEEVLSAANRILRRAGYDDPFNMTMQARYEALKKLPSDEFGVYESEINYFFQYIEDMRQVRELGGLHVIGSERHEARRIDNQLRGRAARQGDPGSSRFYLSMEDELMRLFGGEQADNLLRRLKVDDSVPLEVGLVARLIEQAQTRVEGANFDARKHLLEYDDVLNAQRAKIYAQRDRIFLKDDLSEDAAEMLRTEINRRVPEALDDAEGPWRLLGWLEQIQPTMLVAGQLIPSFTLRVLLESIAETDYNPAGLRAAMLRIAESSLQAEHNHLLRSIEQLIHQSLDGLKTQLSERLETLENYFGSLEDAEEFEPRNPRQIIEEAAELVHLPVRLSREQEKALAREPEQLQEVLEAEVENSLANQTVRRILGAISRRLEEPLEIDSSSLPMDDWDEISTRIMDAIQAALDKRNERLVGQNGSGAGVIVREIDAEIKKLGEGIEKNHALDILVRIPQGTRTTFDRRTHRRMQERTTRLTYIFYAGLLLENLASEVITGEVLEHLEHTQQMITRAWGLAEINRLASITPSGLDQKAQRGLTLALGASQYQGIQNQPFSELNGGVREKVITELGRHALTEIYRELLLRVISELWIEYLTQVEALRIAITLEAYGQRDPLVQYKGRASQLFEQLLDNIRLGVVSRMFTFQPRDASGAQVSQARPDDTAGQIAAAVAARLEATETDDDDELIVAGEEVSAVEQVSPQKTPARPNEPKSKSAKRRRRRR